MKPPLNQLPSPVNVAIVSTSFCKSPTLLDDLHEQLHRQPEQNVNGAIQTNPHTHIMSEDELTAFLNESNAEAAIVGREPVTEKVLKACPSLKLIAKYGVGLDNIDQAAMRNLGVQLGWTPGVNKRGVSELALSFMLGHLRNAFTATEQMRNGKWIKDGGTQLSSQTVGIVGFGHIGQDLCGLLRAFGCNVIFHDIANIDTEAERLGASRKTYEEILASADILTFHVPLDASTHKMCDAKQLEQAKSHALIINTSRGDIVEHNAACNAVHNRTIGGYACDTFTNEPYLVGTSETELAVHPRIYLTPHIAGNSKESVLTMGRSAIDHVRQYIESR